MAYAKFGPLLTRVREVIEESEGDLRAIAPNTYLGDLPEGLDDETALSKAAVKPRVETSITSVAPSDASPPIGGNLRIYDVELTVKVVRVVTPLEQVSSSFRDYLSGLAAEDSDKIGQALGFPGNLSETAAGTATDVVSGLALHKQSRIAIRRPIDEGAQPIETIHAFLVRMISRPTNTTTLTNTTSPVISGTAALGETLSCSTGVWTGPDCNFSYQWNADGSPVSGQTSSEYVITATSGTITCTVTATSAYGATSATSNAVHAGPLTDPAAIEWWDSRTDLSGAVSSWAGRVNGWALTQASGSAQPSYSATGIASEYPGVSFGDDDGLTCSDAAYGAAIAALSAVDVYVVVQDTTTGSGGFVVLMHADISTGAGFAIEVNGFDDDTLDFIGSSGSLEIGVVESAGHTSADAGLIFCGFSNPGTHGTGSTTRRLDDAELTIAELATDCSSGTYDSGSLVLGASSGWVGVIGDVILFTAGNSTQRRARAEWIAARYPNAITLQ